MWSTNIKGSEIFESQEEQLSSTNSKEKLDIHV